MVEQASSFDRAELVRNLDAPAPARAVAFVESMVERRLGGGAAAVRPRASGASGASTCWSTGGCSSPGRRPRWWPGWPSTSSTGWCRLRPAGGCPRWSSTSAPGRVPSPWRWRTRCRGRWCGRTDVSADALAVARANLAGSGQPGRAPGAAAPRPRGSSPCRPTCGAGSTWSCPTRPTWPPGERLPAEVAGWEPAEALVAGPTGLEGIEAVVGGGRRAGWAGRDRWCVELAPHQAGEAAGLAWRAGFDDVDRHRRPHRSGEGAGG